jgi:hypothetical protein
MATERDNTRVAKFNVPDVDPEILRINAIRREKGLTPIPETKLKEDIKEDEYYIEPQYEGATFKTPQANFPNPASGAATYVPFWAAMMPGTPAVKGLGKVGNFVLDMMNPIAGMGKTPGLSKALPPMSNAEWMEKALMPDKAWNYVKTRGYELLPGQYQHPSIVDLQKRAVEGMGPAAGSDLAAGAIGKGDFKFTGGEGKDFVDSMTALAEFGKTKLPGEFSFNTSASVGTKNALEDMSRFLGNISRQTGEPVSGITPFLNRKLITDALKSTGRHTDADIENAFKHLKSTEAKKILERDVAQHANYRGRAPRVNKAGEGVADWKLLPDSEGKLLTSTKDPDFVKNFVSASKGPWKEYRPPSIRSHFFPESAGKNFEVDLDNMNVAHKAALDDILKEGVVKDLKADAWRKFNQAGMLDIPGVNEQLLNKNLRAQLAANAELGKYFPGYGNQPAMTLSSLYHPSGAYYKPYTGAEAFSTLSPYKMGGKIQTGLPQYGMGGWQNIANFAGMGNMLGGMFPGGDESGAGSTWDSLRGYATMIPGPQQPFFQLFNTIGSFGEDVLGLPEFFDPVGEQLDNLAEGDMEGFLQGMLLPHIGNIIDKEEEGKKRGGITGLLTNNLNAFKYGNTMSNKRMPQYKEGGNFDWGKAIEMTPAILGGLQGLGFMGGGQGGGSKGGGLLGILGKIMDPAGIFTGNPLFPKPGMGLLGGGPQTNSRGHANPDPFRMVYNAELIAAGNQYVIDLAQMLH